MKKEQKSSFTTIKVQRSYNDLYEIHWYHDHKNRFKLISYNCYLFTIANANLQVNDIES